VQRQLLGKWQHLTQFDGAAKLSWPDLLTRRPLESRPDR
jgi:hypothetical protein